MKLTTLILLLLFLTGCQPQEDISKYTEVRIKSPLEKMVMGQHGDPHKNLTSEKSTNITWKVPEGWTEKKGSGMRMLTLTKEIEDRIIEISVVELGGPVGGVDANLKRWLGQVGIDDPVAITTLKTQAQNLELPHEKTAKLYDFTSLGGDEWDKSILAAIIEMPSGNLFIKSISDLKDIITIRDDFANFVRTIDTAH